MEQINIPMPSEKQKLFLNDTHKYVAFGGARGGGKSWAVRVKCVLLALRYAGIKVAIVRKTLPELRRNHIDPLRQMLPRTTYTYNDQRKEMSFRNGSVIMFCYCDTDKDIARYQGAEFDIIFLEEATQFDERIFQMLLATLRGVNAFPKRMYITCNPGGPGHAWVKRLFVDRQFKPEENPDDYAPLIQSLVTDNEAMMESSPDYIRQLDALPGKLKAAWRFGDWNVLEGQFFEEFSNRPNPARTNTHVIAPFDPPKDWKRLRSYDWGYNRPFSMGWWAVDHDGRLYRILELYGCTDTPNEGLKWTTEEQFRRIAEIEREHPYLAGLKVEGVADPSIWAENGGVSTASIAAKYGIYFTPGDNKRVPGWMQVHYRMRFDENGLPMMYVFETCKAFIRTVPLLVYDEHMPEDLDTAGEDHVADEVRYMCMLNPINPPKLPPPKPKPYDPLSIDWQDTNEYEFFRI